MHFFSWCKIILINLTPAVTTAIGGPFDLCIPTFICFYHGVKYPSLLMQFNFSGKD